MRAAVADIQELVGSLPDRDDRSPEEILGYDEHGLPGGVVVIDTAALLAILLAEPESGALVEAIVGGEPRLSLNYGDCVPYGVAGAAGEPLLFKGEDFRATDIEGVAV